MSFDSLIAPAYASTLSLLAVYGLHRLSMIRRFRWEAPRPEEDRSESSLPTVTVQLPLYNERTVTARLIQAVARLDYPPQKLEIQVLDDSDDETREVVDAEVRRWRDSGLDISAVRRPQRSGFKAGALDYGLKSARGELVAIFDADFLPRSDFLRQMVGDFDDPEVGLVQARWGHENREDSVLTRAQSTLLDGHFVIEHKVRHDSGLFFNFNGTAGIWRRAAILESGGWQHDTLTEDLDLSYRAQLSGWKFVYRPLVVAPAEVPPNIAAFKSQQHRWAKGSVQVFRKLGWRILHSKEPLRIKLEALVHLTGNIGYPCVLLLALLLPLTLEIQRSVSHWVNLIAFIICTVSVFAFYERSQRALGRPLRRRIRDIFAAVSLGIGMCVVQTRAVVEGLVSDTGAFIRTPKAGNSGTTHRPYRSMLSGLPGIELALAAWVAWGAVNAVRWGLWGSVPFLLLFFVSFAWVGSLSLRSWARG